MKWTHIERNVSDSGLIFFFFWSFFVSDDDISQVEMQTCIILTI